MSEERETLNILVVDDLPQNRTAIELLLEERNNVAVHSAANGKEAVALCAKTSMDIIFMDLMMPEMDGIEATRRIREFDRKAIIVAVTALDDAESKERMLRYGAEDYIVKPIDSRIFARRLDLYCQLALSRKAPHRGNDQAVNPFDKNVYHRLLLFRVADQDSLAEVWEYFLTNTCKDAERLNDCIRVVYGLGSWMLKNDLSFTLSSEENDQYLFLTQCL